MLVQNLINIIIYRMKRYSDRSSVFLDIYVDSVRDYDKPIAERAFEENQKCCHIIASYKKLLIQLAKIQRRERMTNG